MKTIFKLLIAVPHIFIQCKSPAEEYAERPKVQFLRTHEWDYGQLKINARYFTYGKNHLVETIETIDSISEHVGVADTRWKIYLSTQVISYNGSNNISAIKHLNGDKETLETFHYEDEILKYRTRNDGNSIDSTTYTYNGDQVICTYKVRDMLYKNYLTDGILDSTYITQGKYIMGKNFYYYSDTSDFSKVPLAMGEKLYDPCKALTKFNYRHIGTSSEEKVKYEYDDQERPVKITINRCTDYSVTKVGYY